MLKKPIDVAELLEIMDDDDELVKECFTDFLGDCENMLSQIKTAIENSSSEEIEKTAHALKGSLIYLAAGNAAEIAHQLEVMGKNSDIKNALSVFAELADACEKVKDFMRTY